MIATVALLLFPLVTSAGPSSPTPTVAPTATIGAASAPAHPPALAPLAVDPAALYDRVSPAVIAIAASSINASDRADRISRVVGSGMIIDPKGLILTNSHVVYGRQLISVTLDDGTTLPAHLVGADPVLDIALVRIPPPSRGDLPIVTLGDSDTVRVGEDVFALGSPLGLDQTMTRGIVSAINRLLPDVPYSIVEPVIQTDAAINPGSSGGPLINSRGEVVGINTAILPDAEGIGFAIPVALIKQVIPRLLKDGRVIRPWLGVQGQLVAPELKELFRLPLVDGFLIEVVEPDSPAARSDLHGGDIDVTVSGQGLLLGGDILTMINGKPVATAEQVGQALGAMKVGDTLTLDVFRRGTMFQVMCTLPERPVLPADIRASRAIAPLGAPTTARRNARLAF